MVLKKKVRPERVEKILVSNRKGKVYTIIASPYSDLICNCTGYQFRGSCSHIDRLYEVVVGMEGDEELDQG